MKDVRENEKGKKELLRKDKRERGLRKDRTGAREVHRVVRREVSESLSERGKKRQQRMRK